MVGDADGTVRCPKCGKDWPMDHAMCPDDGERLATFGSDTSIDLSPGRASANETNQFDPFSSDIRTYLAHRPYVDEPASRASGSKSSDPPTSFVRRAESHIELPPGSMVGEEYEIDHRLGAGAMGEVYAARHVKLSKRVAIKVISPRLSEDTDAVERFAQEARTLAQMHHPGLVDVLGFGELADGRAYFVMEYLSGEGLFDRLQRGRLDRDEALDVFSQIARALEAAHTHGVVHRDLKPENIFLARATNEPRPIVKILDFGLARLLVQVDRRTERTQSGVVIGTAMYLSPEQARGPDVDGRTDVYALGCIGYELLLGRHPFEDARTIAALIAAHLHDVPPLPRSIDPSIPAELDLMLFAMLAKDPAHRPTLPQIRPMVETLRRAASAAPHPASTVKAAIMSTAPGSINWRTIAVAIAVLVTCMVVGIVIGTGLRGSRSQTRGPAAAAIPDRSGGRAVAPLPPSAPDAALTELATSPPVPVDAAAAARTRFARASRHLPVDAPVVADAATSANCVPVDAGSMTDAGGAADAEPTRTSPAPPTRGNLRILPPQGAQVLVDGGAPAASVSRLSLAPGKHRIQFSLGSNKDAFMVMIEAGKTITLDERGLYQAGPGSDDRNRIVNPFARKPVSR